MPDFVSAFEYAQTVTSDPADIETVKFRQPGAALPVLCDRQNGKVLKNGSGKDKKVPDGMKEFFADDVENDSAGVGKSAVKEQQQTGFATGRQSVYPAEAGKGYQSNKEVPLDAH